MPISVGHGPGPVHVAGLYAPVRTQQTFLPETRNAQFSPAPTSARLSFTDLAVNLLLTTLAVTVVSLPPGKQVQAAAPQANTVASLDTINPLALRQKPIPGFSVLSASAPPPKYQASCEQQINALALRSALIPQFSILSASAPTARFQGVEQQGNAITLRTVVAVTPQVAQISASAPQAKYQSSADVFQNLLALPSSNTAFREALYGQLQPKAQTFAQDLINRLALTTVVATPIPSAPLNSSAPQAKFQAFAEQYVNTLVLGYPYLMPGWIDFEQVPQAKYQPSAEQQINTLPLGNVTVTYPRITTYTNGAPKWQGSVDQPQYPLTLGIPAPPNPAVAQISASAPAVKYQSQVDYFQNLSNTTLFVPFPPPPQTVLNVNASAPAIAYQVQVDYFQNVTVQGIPLPPVVVPPPPLPTSGLLPGRPPPLADEDDLTYPKQDFIPPPRPQGFGLPPVPSPFMGQERAPIKPITVQQPLIVTPKIDEEQLIALLLLSDEHG